MPRRTKSTYAGAQSRLVILMGLAAMPAFSQLPAIAADTKAPAETKSPTPKNRTGTRKLESTIIGIEKEAQPTRITLRDGVLSVSIKPTTELVQEERGVVVADLEIGDKLSLITFKLKGSIRSKAVVTGLNPLVVSIDELATMTITKSETVSFSRYTPFTAEALAIGQTVALEMKLLTGGEIEATRIAVVIEKAKPAKTTNEKSTKPATPKPPANQAKPAVLPTTFHLSSEP